MADSFARPTRLSPAKQRLLQQLLEPRPQTVRVGPPAPSVSALPPSATAILNHTTVDALDPKTACRRFYDTVTEQLDASEFGAFSLFLNYGYVPTLSPQQACVALPDTMLNRNSVRLVLEVLEDCVTCESRVLDVGCGRGGTVSVVTQFFKASRIAGLDLSAAAIGFCHRAHRRTGVSFLQGDAEHLPFADAAFDIVTNIESSCCYPDLFGFYAEAARVLAPGGRFLYADCLPVERHREAVQCMTRLGFTVERERDITPNVLASCDEIARSRVGAYSAGNDTTVLNNFLGAPGSDPYRAMRARQWAYQIYKLRKAGGGTERRGSRGNL